MSSSSLSSKKKMITLKSSDDEIFEVEEAVAVQSETLKNLIEDGCADSAIPLQNVTGPVLFEVIKYCKKHAEAAGKEASKFSDVENNELENYGKDFVKVDQAVLFDLTLAANYLNMKSLLDLTCQTVANMMRGKSPEEIRKIFHIKNDLTPAEEEKIRKENQWAFE